MMQTLPAHADATRRQSTDSLTYLAALMREPEAFEAFTQLTQYYTNVCPR